MTRSSYEAYPVQPQAASAAQTAQVQESSEFPTKSPPAPVAACPDRSDETEEATSGGAPSLPAQPLSATASSGSAGGSGSGNNQNCENNSFSFENVMNSACVGNVPPETLNIPAVLWDRPAGSSKRVPPPVPPRSPRRPFEPQISFAEANEVTYIRGDLGWENRTPLRVEFPNSFPDFTLVLLTDLTWMETFVFVWFALISILIPDVSFMYLAWHFLAFYN